MLLRVVLKAKITHVKQLDFQPSNLGQLRYPINGFAFYVLGFAKAMPDTRDQCGTMIKHGGLGYRMPPAVKIMPRILAPQYSLDTDARFPTKLLLTGGNLAFCVNL